MAFNKNKVMDGARKFVEKGQTDKAIKEYLKVVQHDPKDVRVWLKIGDLYAKKGAKTEATDTYLKVAKFYSEQGFYLKAVAVYKQILKLDPRMVEVNLKLAELYRQLGLLSDAMQHFERVAAHFHREGKTKEALATIRQLVDLDPDNVATRIKLAELYSKEGMTSEAIQEFRHACDYLRSHNRQDDFIKVAERLLWHDATDIALNRELATLYLRRNDPRRALQKLQVCFKADPRDVETLALLAQAFQALEQKAKTVSVLKELARVFTENGQTQQANDVHRKILQLAPDDADTRQALGEPAVPASSTAGSPVADVPRPVLHTPPPAQTPPPRLQTSDFRPPGGRASGTGSVPIVRGDSVSSVRPHLVPRRGETPVHDPAFVAEIGVDEESFHARGDELEANADEIVKILTETDVYVKYGLQQKALDHLKRVFEIDPHNIEARERLKDILVAMGRENDAVDELLTLADQTAAQDVERARGFLAEALALDDGSPKVVETARRLGIDIAAGTGASEELAGAFEEYSDAIELSDGDLGSAVNALPEADALEFDQLERPFEFDLDDAGPAASPDQPITQEVAIDQVEHIAFDRENSGDELSFDDVGDGTNELHVSDIELLDEPAFEPADELEFDDPVDFPAPAESSSGRHGEHPAVADGGFGDLQSAFDAAASRFESREPEARSRAPQPMRVGLGAVPTPGRVSSVDEFAEGAATVFAPNMFSAAGDQPAGGVADFGLLSDDPAADDAGAGVLANPSAVGPGTAAEDASTSLEDDLDEADFFVTQGLYSEARDILSALFDRYPNNPLIVAKLQDIDAMETEGAAPIALDPVEFGDPLPNERIERGIASSDVTGSGTRPQVMLERPIDEADADTHFDLGLAYKEMGLYDEAIKAFQKVIRAPGREVECHTMVGLCFREQGALPDAVQQFKNGLYVDTIAEREKLSLYYEIGYTYELLGDPREALYFFEMVTKKDPKHRDVQDRIAGLQRRASTNGTGNVQRGKAAGGDELEAALDAAFGDSDDASH
jgi:tetratricopeptide (TPR) repeat protein